MEKGLCTETFAWSVVVMLVRDRFSASDSPQESRLSSKKLQDPSCMVRKLVARNKSGVTLFSNCCRESARQPLRAPS